MIITSAFDALLLAWTFMVITSASPANFVVDYSPAYATEAICDAARSGAVEFGAPTPELCTDDPFVLDGQWYQRMRWEFDINLWSRTG